MKIQTCLCLSLLLISFNFQALEAQNPHDTSQVIKSTIRGAEDLKSGNYQDVLTSFFQLAAQDLTGNQHSFQFKTTLFAIKLRADSSLLIDRNFIKQYASRNLQFDINLNFTDDFRFSGFTGGITYAIINQRDHSVANFFKSRLPNLDSVYLAQLNNLYIQFTDTIRKNKQLTRPDKDRIFIQLDVGERYYVKTYKIDSFPQEFKTFVNQTNSLAELDSSLIKQIKTVRDSLYQTLDGKPLWTVAANATTGNSSNLFHSASLQTDFLMGGEAELDIHAKAIYTDTMITGIIHRFNTDFSEGCNFTLFKNKADGKHLVELKGALEYDHVFEGLLPDEKQDNFLANAELRIRILNDIWIPIIIKYDIKNANFLGFLNISANLDAFKSFILNKK